MVRQRESELKVCLQSVGPAARNTSGLGSFPPGSDGVSQSEPMCKTSGGTNPTDLASLGERKDDGSVKLKKHFSWCGPQHNENECRDFAPGPDKKCDRYRIGQVRYRGRRT